MQGQKNALIVTYGSKNQRKGAETATLQWDIKYVIKSLYYRRSSKLPPEKGQVALTGAPHGDSHALLNS